MMEYYYGLEGQEIYDETELEDAVTYHFDDGNINFEIIELKVSNKEPAWCTYHLCSPECQECAEYSAKNGENGICEFRTFGLRPTGRKWFVDEKGVMKKISGRKKYHR